MPLLLTRLYLLFKALHHKLEEEKENLGASIRVTEKKKKIESIQFPHSLEVGQNYTRAPYVFISLVDSQFLSQGTEIHVFE